MKLTVRRKSPNPTSPHQSPSVTASPPGRSLTTNADKPLLQAFIADRTEGKTAITARWLMRCPAYNKHSNNAVLRLHLIRVLLRKTHLLLKAKAFIVTLLMCTELGKKDAECSNRTQNVSFWVVTRSCTKVLRG